MSFLTNLFGKTKVETAQNGAPISNYQTPGFNGGGLTGSFSGNNYSVSPDANRSGTVGGLSGTYGSLGDQYGGLLKTVAPGGSDALRAQLTDIGNQATSAIGNLWQNLQSRRILGSSFGQDTLSRLQNTIEQNRTSAIAKQYQTDLQNSTSLIGQQYDAYSKQYQTALNELNLEGGMASDLSNKAAGILSGNAQALAKLNEQGAEFNAKTSNDQASGLGSFLGRMVPSGLFGSMFGGSNSSYDVNNGYVPNVNGGGIMATR